MVRNKQHDRARARAARFGGGSPVAQWEEPRALKMPEPPGEISEGAGKDTLVNTGKQHGAEHTGTEPLIAPPALGHHRETPDRSRPSSPTALPRRHTPLSDTHQDLAMHLFPFWARQRFLSWSNNLVLAKILQNGVAESSLSEMQAPLKSMPP